MTPTIGRIVHYTLSEQDASEINHRRDHVAHVGNEARPGQVYPAMVVRVWDEPEVSVNLQVHLDGNDAFWATSRKQGGGPGQWAWPEREA